MATSTKLRIFKALCADLTDASRSYGFGDEAAVKPFYGLPLLLIPGNQQGFADR
jgi:uncharacterized protein (DUF2236 family)